MSSIRVPVKKKVKVASYKNLALLHEALTYTTEERSYDAIRKQINLIYKKIIEARKLEYEPTYLIINRIDYEFIKAYFRYSPDVYNITNTGYTDKLKTIFGLKIIVSDKKQLTVGWEP